MANSMSKFKVNPNLVVLSLVASILVMFQFWLQVSTLNSGVKEVIFVVFRNVWYQDDRQHGQYEDWPRLGGVDFW